MSLQKSSSKNFLINSVLAFIPVSYIAGNLILNLNVFLLILLFFFFYRLQLFKKDLGKFDKLIIILFLYIFVNGILNNFLNFDFSSAQNKNVVLIKSILFLRFLIVYLIIKFLIKEGIIDFKLILLAFGGVSLFVSVDIIFQFFNGKDLFGFDGSSGRRLAGPFGDEFIAGSFIQRFFIFIILFSIFFLNIKSKLLKLTFYFIVFFTSFIGIFFSGNRIPLILFFLTLSIFCFYEKEIRKTFIIVFIISLFSIGYLAKTNKDLNYHYNLFYINSTEIVKYLFERLKTGKGEITNIYNKELESGFVTWEQNKIFGGGIKSFYWNCLKVKDHPTKKFGGTNCNSHPHNYYIEIASELGLTGLFLVCTLFLFIFYKVGRIVHLSKVNNNLRLLTPFFIVFLVEIFPLKTTGSFFTTTNATFLFIILSFVVGLSEVNKKITNYAKK